MRKCNRHGQKYQIDPSSVLCSHPECIKRIIIALSDKSKAIAKQLKICEDHHADDDMVGYIIERLLIEAKEGKPLVINKTFLWFTLNRFIRDWMIQIAVEDELQDVYEETPESYSGWYQRKNAITAEDILIGKELSYFIRKNFGDNYLLFASGYIGRADLMKLENCGWAKLHQKLKEMQDFISKNLK